MRILMVLALAFLIGCQLADAGTVKGSVYNPDGTLYKAGNVTIDVLDATSGTLAGTGKSAIDGTYTLTFDAAKVTTTGDKAGTVVVRYTKNTRQTTVSGASTGGTGTKIGGLLGLGAITHTIHAVVVGD